MNDFVALVRVFIDSPEVGVTVGLLADRLSHAGRIRTQRTERYWKEPEWRIATFEVESSCEAPEAVVAGLEATLGHGWIRIGGGTTLSSTWSPSPSSEAGSFGVRFVNIEIIREKHRRGRLIDGPTGPSR